ncbi:ras GEF [Rhizoclosmatium globosum]|uniref:Ras GEF n=1 Tax=Rhizoclosmatium globosum TaxID=329046 RepID=A0A1Y2BIJ0_9FUNG|nr:ras GEF [Rhizoclosmatium globosum]|eukprot:ORY33915.1 ras GEF [Rhizoclosmatium globosum]
MDIIGRVKVMTKWFKVAVFLKKFNNFQGLKAVTSALNTPPITRLKKTWAHLRKKNANDLTEFEDLCALVSEQSNYSAYRQFIKTNQTRPIVPFLGVILHDVTYLMAVAKKESIDIASDKRIQEIQKFIRYCSLGPRYSYEMLIDLDLAQSTAAGTSNLQKKGIKRKVQGGGLTEQGVETLGALFKDANEEDIGSFISHWLLTRKWVSEKEVDDMSASREPKVVKAPTVSSYDANSTEDREQIQSRISDDESTMSKTSFEAAQTSSFLRPKEVSALAASPALTRTRTIAGSTSFIEAIKETAYTLVTNKSKQQATQSGTNSPASGSTLNTAKAPAKAGKQLTPEISRGKQLDQLLRRRQKSMTNLEGDDLVGATKSISMDAGINGRPNSAIIQSSESKAGSFDSISGSIGHSTINGLANATTDEPASAYGPGYGAIESEELKRKLEILVNAADALEPRTRRRSSSSTNSAVPKDTPASGAASGNHRHNFFTSFFSYPEEASESESISAKGGSQSLHQTHPTSQIYRRNL